VRKLGLIAYANNSGLGAQTRRLAQMLRPELVMIIDSQSFSVNRKQHFEWYKDYKHFTTRTFPSDSDVIHFMQDLTHIFLCEDPYNFNMLYWAKQKGIKVYCQSNYEFCQNLNKHYLPRPDLFLMPSYWMIDDMESKFGKNKVKYLPPPLDSSEFKEPRKDNMARTIREKRRFLHVIGTLVSEDRNGTLDLLEAVKLSKSDYKLVIHSQHPLPIEYYLEDPRIVYRMQDFTNNFDIYRNFDAFILPRRFGGLSLTTNEALASGLPVIMTDISPNNKLLPKDWLIQSEKKGQFFARSEIPLYSADHKKLAKVIDNFTCDIDSKVKAFEIAEDNFSPKVLKPKYDSLLFDEGKS
jgi:glycosyltransferase involved in cell wall biosynthesis